ncbi:MAG: hypothetical protein ACT4QB_05415 [Gammaproteobacteria bacterium]
MLSVYLQWLKRPRHPSEPQIGTALFYDPLICPKVNAGLRDYLERHGFTSVSELVGSLLEPPSLSAWCTGQRTGRCQVWMG